MPFRRLLERSRWRRQPGSGQGVPNTLDAAGTVTVRIRHNRQGANSGEVFDVFEGRQKAPDIVISPELLKLNVVYVEMPKQRA